MPTLPADPNSPIPYPTVFVRPAQTPALVQQGSGQDAGPSTSLLGHTIAAWPCSPARISHISGRRGKARGGLCPDSQGSNIPALPLLPTPTALSCDPPWHPKTAVGRSAVHASLPADATASGRARNPPGAASTRASTPTPH